MQETIARSIGTAIVTGPTGAIGIALCEKLLEQGAVVYAICRPGSPRIVVLPQNPRLHMILCDAAQLETLPATLPGVRADAFFHLAWAATIGPGRNDMPAQIANIRTAIAAVRAAAAFGCSAFVGVGSQAEYGRVEGILHPQTPCNPENGYGMAKLCAGQMSRVEAEQLGLAHVWARVLSVYGPHDGPNTLISTAIRKLLCGERPALTPGGQVWDYLYAADAADALYRMAVHGRAGNIYPLGSGTARPLREYIEQLRNAIDPELPLGFGECPYAPRQVMHLQADIAPLAMDTGFAPGTNFETGIRQTIEWVRSAENERKQKDNFGDDPLL